MRQFKSYKITIIALVLGALLCVAHASAWSISGNTAPLYAKTVVDARLLTGGVLNTTLDIGGHSIEGDGGGGHFIWDTSDLSAQVTADPLFGIYISVLTDITGATGAWVRQYSDATKPEWWYSGTGYWTYAFQAAIDAAQGGCGVVQLSARTYDITTGTLYVQRDTSQSINADYYKPLHIRGQNATKPNPTPGLLEGSTVIKKTDAGDMFRLNVDASGDNPYVNPTPIGTPIQLNYFKMSGIVFLGTQGISTRAMWGSWVRAVFENLTFIDLEQGIDFLEITGNTTENYSDYPRMTDIQVFGAGKFGIQVANADVGVFKSIYMQNFQAGAVSGISFKGGRGFSVEGVLMKGLEPLSQGAIVLSGSTGARIKGWQAVSLNSTFLRATGSRGISLTNGGFYNFAGSPGVTDMTLPVINITDDLGNHEITNNTFTNDRTSATDIVCYGPANRIDSNAFLEGDSSTVKPSSEWILVDKTKQHGTSGKQPGCYRIFYDGAAWKVHTFRGVDVTSEVGVPVWNVNYLDLSPCSFADADFISFARVLAKFEPAVYLFDGPGIRFYPLTVSAETSIASGSTSVVIAHGLEYTPSVKQINIMAKAATTNPIGNIWVDTIGATNFTVHCENDPGVSAFLFAWSISSSGAAIATVGTDMDFVVYVR